MEKSERVKYEIKSALSLSGMTQKALAARLRWSRDHLNRILRTPSKIRLDELEAICNALEMKVTFGKGKE